MSEAISILLMVDPGKGHVFPFSPRGLGVATRPVAKLWRENAEALFLDGSGRVLRLGSITLRRNSLLARVGLYLGIPVPADIGLAPVDIGLDEFRALLLDCRERTRDQFADDEETWWLLTAPADEVRAELGRAQSLADLHARMRFPADEDCLDLL